MSKLLYIIASPRQKDSKSAQIADHYVAQRRRQDPVLTVDTLDLWHETLPEFDGNKAAAKMTFFGVGTLDATKKTAWDRVVEVTKRFTDADEYLFAAPMWNGGVPYRLKLYIDIITQPDLTFGFDPAQGYFGLLKNKMATLVYTSGVYAPGVPEAYGVDFHSTYLQWWLGSIGVTAIRTIRFQPTLLTADPAGGLNAALAEAERLAAA